MIGRKVKVHCADGDIVPQEHQAGNIFADHYGGRAVNELRVLRLDRKTALMQERMVQATFLLPIRARHPEDTKDKPATPCSRAPRLVQAHALEHEVVRRGPWLE